MEQKREEKSGGKQNTGGLKFSKEIACFQFILT